MANNGKLKKAFEDVRRDFFPRWDPKGLWRVRSASFLAPLGRCEISRKVIFIRAIPDAEDELKQLLIHEICHHNASGHGAKWRRNMEAIRQRAEAIGQQPLAEWVKKEIQGYQEQDGIPDQVYPTFGDWIIDTKGKVPYKRLIVALAREFGLTVNQVEKGYKRLKRIYDEQRAFLKRMEEAKKRF